MRLPHRVALVLAAFVALPAAAEFHLWQVSELYSNAAGNVQFVELTAQSGGQQFLAGHTITSTNGGATNTFTFPAHLPGDTAGKRMLIGTQSFTAMGVVTPDYVVPDHFFFRGNFTINFAEGSDVWNNSSGAMTVPTDGGLSLARSGVTDTNSPLNFANATATVFPLALPADVNGDGRTDIVWRNVATGQVYRMAMNGAAITAQSMVYTEPNTQWAVVADGDFTGDGRTDLLWRNLSTGQVYVMPFDANGNVAPGAVVYTEPDSAWRIIQAPDIDGDGQADILWYHAATGQLYAMLMDGLAIGVQGMVHTEPDTSWRVVATGDFFGNGRSHVVWHNNSGGELYLMSVTVEAGAFRTAGSIVYREPDTAWRIVGAADFDGDLLSDLLWRNNATGQVFAMLMSGTTIKGGGMVHVEPDANWRIVALGDYDGDFRADILWRNAASGQVYQMRMNGLAVAAAGMIYTEPSASWHVMGLHEYGSVGLP